MDIEFLKSFSKSSVQKMTNQEKTKLLINLKAEFLLENSSSTLNIVKIRLIKKISRMLYCFN